MTDPVAAALWLFSASEGSKPQETAKHGSRYCSDWRCVRLPADVPVVMVGEKANPHLRPPYTASLQPSKPDSDLQRRRKSS
jgi:hypothetical protein